MLCKTQPPRVYKRGVNIFKNKFKKTSTLKKELYPINKNVLRYNAIENNTIFLSSTYPHHLSSLHNIHI